ncbi:MAG: hypothetical protein E7673_05615 [Ruminococcaceae bacterium]|nr:hypothetical protein [Oscillospiraceae bacterium]
MPFIDLKTTVKINENTEEILRKEFGKIITLIPGKSEAWLMLNFSGEQKMAFRGNADGECAMVSVDLLGGASDKAYDDMTRAICLAVNKILGVPLERTYVKYSEFEHWGFAGENF